MKILVTGAAGFIGSMLALRLLEGGDIVYGIDNISNYYDISLKKARLERLSAQEKFTFQQLDISNNEGIKALFDREQFDAVMNLAAQVGVRYSIQNPHAYIQSNVVGFCNILEGCRHSKVGHLVFASSSSVYGANTKLPFSEKDNVDHPISLYAATKKANELMAHSYAHLYSLPCTGLRFFTVYGPWGRPDMALFIFTKAILEGRPIPVFNNGYMIRDFTYVDDIVEGIVRVINRPAAPDQSWSGDAPSPSRSKAPYCIYNIGNNKPVQLMRYIEVLEKSLGRKAQLDMLPMQAGDVPATKADVSELQATVGYHPSTPVEVGVPKFVEWYKSYYRIS
jgi:UDP-glucuronate 4-epimerase